MMQNVVSKTIDHLSEWGHLSGIDVANVTDVSKSTVSRCTNLLIFPEYLDFGEDLTVAEAPSEINWPAWIDKNHIQRGIQF